MPHYQAHWRAATDDHDRVVDHVGKVFFAPSLADAKRMAGRHPPPKMALMKVVELGEINTPAPERDPPR